MQKMTIQIAVALLSLLVLAGTSAALLPEMTREDLIIGSETIVQGTVSEVRCAWAEDHSSIYTYVTLDVADQFKGAPVGSELVIQIPGGQVGEITQWVSDTPTLVPGMEVILHLFLKETGYLWIYGWEKGVLLVDNGTIPDYLMTVDQFRQLVKRTTERAN